MSTRITTGMIAAQHPGRPQPRQRAARPHAAEDRLEQGDHAPVGRPVQHVARAGAADVDGEHAAVPAQHPGRAGLAGDRGDALADITDAIHRAHELVVEGASDTTPAEARLAIAAEIDQLIESVKENGNATYRGRYVFAGTATDAPPYVAGDDAYHGSTDEVERQIGPGVGLPIGAARQLVPRQRRRRQAAAGPARRLRAPQGRRRRRRCAADLALLDAKEDELLGARALNGARQNRLDAALGRLAEVEESTLKQLSDDRGRRHRQDADRVQLPAGRLPGRAARPARASCRPR